jgi:hypothetical protein
MPNAFERTFNERVIPAANRGFGVEVVVSFGVQTSEPFTARRSAKDYRSEGSKYGIEVAKTLRDYLLPVASIVFQGAQVEPKKLFVVHETETGESFEVLAPDEDTPAVELMPGGFEWLVHTRKREAR